MDESPIIGIDLGTTYSAVSAMIDGQLTLFPNALGETLTPSAVAKDPQTGAFVVGRTAKDLWVTHPGAGTLAFKRDMGDPAARVVLGGDEMSPVELSACVLAALRADAERALQRRVARCVVTVPAYFNDVQRYATRCAAELAGLRVERLLNEPTAAAISHGVHGVEDDATFLVFDLGGGTFDVSVMEVFDGTLQVLSVAGESQLGGEDFTRALAEHALRRVGGDWQGAEASDPMALALLLKRAELGKRALSRWPQVDITVPAIAGVAGDDNVVVVSREDAGVAWKDLLVRLTGACRAALRGANLSPADLSQVLLVGGATRMPHVRDFVAELFGVLPTDDVDPDLAVVRGAGIQAALCARDEAVEDVVVTDVTSHSLGVAVARELGSQWVTGYFLPVIHRNTVLPTSRTEVLSATHAGQKELRIDVFEGDARRVDDNSQIGSFKVKGLPTGREPAQVSVTFSYDVDGLLEVEATVIDTGKAVQRIFERQGGALSPSQIAEARERFRALKKDPLEQARNRALVARAELLWRDHGADKRVVIDAALASFEQAMATRTPRLIDAAHAELLALCEHLDGGERW